RRGVVRARVRSLHVDRLREGAADEQLAQRDHVGHHPDLRLPGRSVAGAVQLRRCRRPVRLRDQHCLAGAGEPTGPQVLRDESVVSAPMSDTNAATGTAGTVRGTTNPDKLAAPPPKPIKRGLGDRGFDVVNTIFLVAIVVIIGYPLWFIAVASISNPDAVNSGQVWLWPVDLTLDGYKRVFEESSIWTGYRN